MWTTILQLVGLLTGTAAAFTIDPSHGFVALGVSAVYVGWALESD